MKDPFIESISKRKIISIYVATTIIGTLLIFAAVYNASSELEILHEINHMHNIFSNQIEKKSPLINGAALDSSIDTEKYRTYLYSKNTHFKINGSEFSKDAIAKSRINERGGYLTKHDNTYTWVLIALPQSKKKLLVMHQYHSFGNNSLLLAYKERLIIPAVFFIWMAVWGALVLNNLVKQILIRKEAAEYLALHDPLTNLANRNLFNDKLNEVFLYSVRHQLSFCVAIVDLDRFKHINDTYGHNVGDELLKQVAARFKQIVRNYDIVARLGGDEFIILLPDSDKEKGIEIYERIYQELIKPYSILNNELTIGVSLGISVFPEHAQDTFELIRLADKAMYVAKNSGTGIEVHDEPQLMMQNVWLNTEGESHEKE